MELLLPQQLRFQGSRKTRSPKLTKQQIASIGYHAKFNYPLTKFDLKKWLTGTAFPHDFYQTRVKTHSHFFYAQDKKDILDRLKREKYSKKKLVIAQKAAQVLKNFPTIVGVGITGSLAMNNASWNSDIDLLIVTKNHTLWLTRGMVLITLRLLGFDLRSRRDVNEKDKLCLNLWMDESDLVWRDRNEYTAHELAQIVPLVDKNHVMRRLLWVNKWLLKYWPHSVSITKIAPTKLSFNLVFYWFNKLAFATQYLYMYSKISCEVIRLTRAQLHPKRAKDFLL